MNLKNFITPIGEQNDFDTILTPSNFLDQLSSEQKQAVTDIVNNQIISAGAGSGKTRVLTYKIAYLILTGVEPSKILALTFTNKAANEMKSRIVELVNSNAVNDLWMGTFHSIFLRILRENPDFIKETMKLNQHFVIYDQKSKNTVLEMIIEKYIKDYKDAKKQNDKKKLQEILFEISDDISKIKNEGKKIDDFLKDKKDELNSYSKEYIHNIYKDYRIKLRNSNAIDFDDILLYTYLILSENETISQKYKNKFNYILIDEYQDTNTIQFNIIDLILGKGAKISAVGDEAQCIYSFRGSKIENIQKFREKYHPLEYKLTINYRSTKTIVEASNSLIKVNEGQSSKQLFSKEENNFLNDNKIKIISSNNEKEEAEKVIEKIMELKNADNELNNYGSFAILYRTHKQSEPFESKLKEKDIPYKIIGKIPFLNRDIIEQIISYLRIVLNEKDNISLQKIFSFSFNELRVKIKKIFDKADKNKEIYWNVIINNLTKSKSKNNDKIDQFIEFIKFLKEKIDEEEPSYFIEQIVEFIEKTNSFPLDEEDIQLIISLKNIAEYLTNKFQQNLIANNKSSSIDLDEENIFINKEGFNFNNIFENLNSENINQGKNIFAIYSIKEFLDDLILLNLNEDITENIFNINNKSENQIAQNNSNKVKLMTIHSSKGLEFNSVFIVGVEEGFYPIINNKIKEENKKKHVEEERRMFYVAITRAKQNCFISYAHNRLMGNGMIRKREKSRFINELQIDNGDKYLDLTDDIINDDKNNFNFFAFNNSSFNHYSKNKIINTINYKSKSMGNNKSNVHNKNRNNFKKSYSHSFLGKKRFSKNH